MLAECVLDECRLVGPVGPEDATDAVGLGLDAPLAAAPARTTQPAAGRRSRRSPASGFTKFG
ncbi:hypothetical protein ADL25_33670 [Streptomyces sp. NRRL F-5122]|nr:hypothetical protein ADL25_33670 [Streptomyces sp. NRRL F-5122]